MGGNPQGLSTHLSKLGVFSQNWAYSTNYLNYPVDYLIFNPKAGLLINEFRRFKFFLKMLFRFQIIHYNFGQTLFNPPVGSNVPWHWYKFWYRIVRSTLHASYLTFMQSVELYLLKRMGKRISVHYQGDDARQGGKSKKLFDINIASQVDRINYYSFQTDRFKKRQIDKICAYADFIYTVNPDLLHFLPTRAVFVPYCHINLEEWTPKFTQDISRPLRIGHAPTNQAVKGTKIILNSLESLKNKGYELEVVLVENVSNQVAKSIYEDVDILVDQLFAGWYGGLALECMALGKPVIAYIREGDLQFIPLEMRAELPIIQANSTNIEDVLQWLLKMPRKELVEIGKKSRLFVEKWHNPYRIAGKIKNDYEKRLIG